MKNSFKLGALFFFMLFAIQVKGQVLISLLFGDKLNSEKIEFGLIGGMNRSYINDISTANGLNSFNLGFYFHILAKNNGYLSTGVFVKSNVGAKGMPTYTLGNVELDDLYKDGELTKKINYFYVPIMYQQRFQNRWYLEGGFQLGLRNKSYDIFKEDVLGGDLEYTIDVKDTYKRLDAGLVGGVGYKFKKEIKSIAAGVNYYYGLVNVSDVSGTTIKNSSIYFYVKIPIGAGKNKENEAIN